MTKEEYIALLKKDIEFREASNRVYDMMSSGKTKDLIFEAAKNFLRLLESKEWAIVPVEPTTSMENAGLDGANLKMQLDFKGNPTGQKFTIDNEECSNIFKAMLEEAPEYNPGNPIAPDDKVE